MHRRRSPARALYATLAALALIAGTWALTVSRPSGAPVAAADGAPLSVAEECAKALGYPARTSADRTWLRTCVHALTAPTVPPTPSGSPTSPPTATPTAPPTTTVPPTTTAPPTTVPPTSTPPVLGGCPALPAFPDASCTGWQHTGVTLKTCVEGDGDEGDGHLERANAVYDGCRFDNGANIQAAGITITRSYIRGTVKPHDSMNNDYKGLRMVDVEIDGGPNPDPDFASISLGHNMTCVRCNVHNGATGVHLGNNSELRDSWVHDFADTGSHGAAVGIGQGSGNNARIIHNSLQCNRTNGAAHCSSAASLYDEPTLNNVLVMENLLNTVSGYGSYGGGPQGTNIRYIDNVFGQKYFPTCGPFGPIAAFYSGNAGNQWTGNVFEDGRPVAPSSNT